MEYYVFIDYQEVEKNRYILTNNKEFYDTKPNIHGKNKYDCLISQTPKKANGPCYVRLRSKDNKRLEIQARILINLYEKYFNENEIEENIKNGLVFTREKTIITRNNEEKVKKINGGNMNEDKMIKIIRVNKETLLVDNIYNSINEAAKDNGILELKIRDEDKVVNNKNGYLLRWTNEKIGDKININVKGSTAYKSEELNYEYVKINMDFIVEKLYINRVSITETRNDFKFGEKGYHICNELKCYFKKYENEKVGDKIKIPDEIIKRQILKLDKEGNIIKKYFSLDEIIKEDKDIDEINIRLLLRDKRYGEYEDYIYKRREFNDNDKIDLTTLTRRTYLKGGEKEKEKEIIFKKSSIIKSDENMNSLIKLYDNEYGLIMNDDLYNIKKNMYVITNYGRIFNNNNGKELSGSTIIINTNNEKVVSLQREEKDKLTVKISSLVYYYFIDKTPIPNNFSIKHINNNMDDEKYNYVDNIQLEKIQRKKELNIQEKIKKERIKEIGEDLLIDDILYKKINQVDGHFYNDYYINQNGQIYSKKSNTILIENIYNKYVSYTLYDINNKKMTQVRPNRILAYVYDIKNKDNKQDENKIINKYVDHIDENKNNDNINNLQLLTNRENMIKSVGQKITIIDLNGKIINIFNSISEASNFYNFKRMHPSFIPRKSTKFEGYYRYFIDGDEINKIVNIN